MNKLFREQETLEKVKTLEAKMAREKVLLERMRKTEQINESKDMQLLNEVLNTRKKQMEIAAQVKRKQEIERQKIEEEKLAKLIEGKKKDAMLEQSLRLQLRNTPELRELEKQLLIARVAKEQAMQKAQNIAAERLRKEEEKKLENKLSEEIRKEEAALKLKEKEKKYVQKQYHKALDNQIILQSASNANRDKELRDEREEVDRMVENLLKEDLEREKKKIDDKNKYRNQIEEYQKIKRQIEQMDSERRRAEEAKAADFRLAQSYRDQEMNERKQLELVTKLKKQKILFDNLKKIEDQKVSEETLRLELAVEEKELKEKLSEKTSALKKKELKANTLDIYSQQIQLRKQREELEKKEDELLMKAMMEKLYKEEQFSLLSNQKKKEKEKEYREKILSMIDERRTNMIAEKEKEIANANIQKEMEKEKQTLVEKERQRILLENAGELLGFLPKGILKDVEEVKKLGEEFKRFYLKDETES